MSDEEDLFGFLNDKPAAPAAPVDPASGSVIGSAGRSHLTESASPAAAPASASTGTGMRNTSTGGVLEAMIIPSLRLGGYTCQLQARIGCRPGGRAHKVDAIAERGGERILISLKWQQVAGTAEQKVPFEVICLAEAIQGGEYQRAYLALGGEGWTLREYFVGGGLNAHLVHADKVKIVTLERFVALANQGAL